MNEFERRQIEIAQNDRDLRKISRDMGKPALIEHFGYTGVLGSIAAPLVNGVTQSLLIPIQADAWFVLQYISTCVILPNSPSLMSPSGNIQLQLTDTGNGEVLFNTPGPAAILTGTPSRAQSGIPLLLPIPRIIRPNTNVKADVTQFGVNVGNNQQPVGFFLSLMGSRVAQI